MPSSLTRIFLGVAVCGLLFTAACTKPPEDPEVAKLKAQNEAGEKRIGEIETEIKAAKDDPAALASATEDKELLKSRLERIREQLRDLGAIAPAPESAEAGSGHGAAKAAH